MHPADGALGHVQFVSQLPYFGKTKNKDLSVASIKHSRLYDKKTISKYVNKLYICTRRAQGQPVNNSHLEDTTSVTDLMSSLYSTYQRYLWSYGKIILNSLKKKFRMP